jgi:hypothetical protein
MLFQLLCLHNKGIALGNDELAKAPRYTGNLVVEDWREGNASGRALRMAKFLDTKFFGHNVCRELLPPLFEPALVKMTDKQMMLHGYVIGVEDRVVAHYTQYWVLQMVDAMPPAAASTGLKPGG